MMVAEFDGVYKMEHGEGKYTPTRRNHFSLEHGKNENVVLTIQRLRFLQCPDGSMKLRMVFLDMEDIWDWLARWVDAGHTKIFHYRIFDSKGNPKRELDLKLTPLGPVTPIELTYDDAGCIQLQILCKVE